MITEQFYFLRDQTLVLLPEKAIFWKEKKKLIISDLHLGKAGHFRKAGIPIPQGIHRGDLERLETITRKYSPEEIIFLGDLFHSKWNREWQEFSVWRENNKVIKLQLVKGNHDIIPGALL